MTSRDTVFLAAAIIGTIATIAALRSSGKTAGQAVDDVVDFFTIGAARPGEAPAANPISRTADAAARAVLPIGDEATIGTAVFDAQQSVADWLQSFFTENPDKPEAVSNIRAQAGPLLPKDLADVFST